MDRRVKGAVRTGATAVGVAAGLMVMASTAQTPDGFVYAGFGGPLDVFGTTTSDVLAIGDGASDATELATLLKAPGPATAANPETPYRVSIEAGSTPSATTVNVFPTLDPTTDDPSSASFPEHVISPPPKPAIDEQGRVDCTGAVSCSTDPVTKATTVTYPDGVVAIVQKVNDLTVVAYKALERLPIVSDLLPPLPAQSVPPSPTQVLQPPVETAPTAPVLPPSTQVDVPSIDPGPPAPDVLLPDEEIQRGPRVKVTAPPLDFGRDTDLGEDLPKPIVPKPNVPSLGKVKDALGSAVDAIKDAVGNAIGPGASNKPPAEPSKPAGPGSSSGGDSDTGNAQNGEGR